MKRSTIASLAVLLAASRAIAQSATFNAADPVLRSSGALSGASDWTLSQNGYLGTYITLAQPGNVSFTINAQGSPGSGAAPHTYIENYRKGPANFALRGPGSIPLLPGTQMSVSTARNAFNFVGTVSGSSNNDSKDMLANNPAVGTQAHQFQQFINQYFNTIVPSNAGKWSNNEPTQGNINTTLVDKQLNYAQAQVNEFKTNLSATVNADGSIDFTGFYGDYTIGGQSFVMEHVKGTTQYQVNLAAPPDWHFWNVNNDGSFTNAANWTNGVPNAVGKTAHFGPAPAPRSVLVDFRVTLGQINFDSTASYTLSGGAGITLDGPAGVAAIHVANGSHTISSPMGLNDDVVITIEPPSSTLNLTSSLSAQGRKISKVGPGTLQMAFVRAGSLEVAGGMVRVSEKPTNNSPTGTSSVSTLSIAAGSSLDLTNNNAAINYDQLSPAGEITAMLAGGYNGGAWNGSGIASSSAAAASTTPVKTAIGVAEATDLFSSFPVIYGGVVIDSTSLLLQYTISGDANLDGTADIGDFSVVATNFNQSGRWFSGDFNYDQSIDIADFAALAANFNQAISSMSSRSVPEPSGALVTLLIAARLRVRRESSSS